MGWLLLVGSLKIQVSFAKEPIKETMFSKGNLDYGINSYHPAAGIMGWLLLVGSLKVQVSFAKEPCKRDYILQQKPRLWNTLLLSCCRDYTSCGVATISGLLKIIGVFCGISSLLQGSFAKETQNFTEPTNRSHRIFNSKRALMETQR